MEGEWHHGEFQFLNENASPPEKPRGKTFWSRVEDAGEAMEIGLRVMLGIFFASLAAGFGWWLGNHIWVGVALVLSMAALLPGFLTGFFWLEVKFALKLCLRFLIGISPD
ncbi:MAG: hypothetical protein R3F11_06075 [Verrucomicrobiales bacterium]